MYCHLNVKTGTRADGQSAVAKYEYICRIGKYSFGFHDDVVHVESGNMPAFAASDPRLYWIAADEYERSNGRLFRSLTGALPNALDVEARLVLARYFAAEVTGGELPYTLALHAGDVDRGGAPDNPHFHLVFSERVNDGVLRSAEAWFRRAAAKGKDSALGGARKSTRTKPREWLVATRHGWADKLNQALERAGIADRVTAESHETLVARAAVAGDVREMERLLLNPPAPHIGPSAKHRWEDRDLEEQPDRYAQYEEAVERAWSIWWAHTKQIAEAEVGWAQVDALDVRIAELEAEQRAEEAAAAEREEREQQETERREAEERRRADLEEREVAVDAVSQGHVWRMEEQQEVLASADRPPTLDEREGIVERVERRIGEDLDRRKGEIGATALGATLLQEMSGVGDAGAALRNLAARERAVEEVEQRVGKDLEDREEELRSIAPGEQYLAEAKHALLGGAERPATFAERESIVTTAEQRLGEELDDREVRLVKSVGSSELLVDAFSELCMTDGSFGDGSSLPERWRIITLAEQWHEDDRADDAERAAALDDLEAMLKGTSSGVQHLAAAQKDVLGGWGKELAPLAQREATVRMAVQAVEQELDRREAAVCKKAGGETLLGELRSQRVGDGSSLLTLVEREKLIDTAERQLREQRRTKLFQHRDGKSLYCGKLDELELSWRQTGRALNKHIDAALDHAEGTLAARARQAAEEREQRLDAGLAALRERWCRGVSVSGEWFYTRKLEELERGQRQSSPERREQVLGWAERQMDRLDSLRAEGALDLFFHKLAELGAAQRPEDIERSLDHAEEQLRQAAERRQARIGALSEDERVFYNEKLDALEPSWRETRTAQPANMDAALDYAGTQLDTLDQDIECRRVDIHGTPGDGYARLLRAGFESESRQRKVQALTSVETYLNEDFDRQEEKIRAGGEDFLRRARVEVLGDARQPETLSDRSAVIKAAKVHLRHAETKRREARHQMVSDTPGGTERLRAAGWEKARTDSEQDRVLATVEHDLTADLDHRERELRTDDEGEAFLCRSRVEVLEADRNPETLAERGRVLERAEALRQAAMADRKRRAAEQRVARLKRLFGTHDGDEAFFTALDAQKPTWRQTGTRAVDVDIALDIAERSVDRRKTPAAAEHKVVVEAEQKFPDTPSTAWRQAGERFPEGSTHARMSQRLADRTLVCALAAEREEPPASSALVQRLFTWLRAQIDKLLERLGLVQPAIQQTVPAFEAAVPAQPVSAQPTAPNAGTPSRSVGGQATPATDKPGQSQVAAGHRTDTEEARRKSVSDREFVVRYTVPGGEERLRAEGHKIHGGSSRRLSQAEREAVASTVEAWVLKGVRADVDRVVGETRAAVGFAPPVQIWREVGHQLHQEREYIPGSRPSLLISTLRTLPKGTADVLTDEEQTLQAALDEQRRAEAEERHQKALKVHRRDLQVWKNSGSLFRRRGWRKPKKPEKPEPRPHTQEQVKEFRMDLTIRVAQIVRGRLEQMYSQRERARPLRPGERPPAPSTARVSPQRPPGRGYDWSH